MPSGEAQHLDFFPTGVIFCLKQANSAQVEEIQRIQKGIQAIGLATHLDI